MQATDRAARRRFAMRLHFPPRSPCRSYQWPELSRPNYLQHITSLEGVALACAWWWGTCPYCTGQTGDIGSSAKDICTTVLSDLSSRSAGSSRRILPVHKTAATANENITCHPHTLSGQGVKTWWEQTGRPCLDAICSNVTIGEMAVPQREPPPPLPPIWGWSVAQAATARLRVPCIVGRHFRRRSPT